MSLLPEVSKNDVDMLFLSMSSSELNLLKLLIQQCPSSIEPVSIKIKDYLVLEGIDIDMLMQLGDDDFYEARERYFDEAVATAKKVFSKSFKYREDKCTVIATLFGSMSYHPDDYDITMIFSDGFYKALTCVGFNTVGAMLDTYSKPPISQLARAYSAKLYVLLTQRQLGKNHVCIAYGDLREELCIDEEAYSLMQNFKRRVLDLAVADINEYTMLDVSYEDVMDGRKITHFDFTITQKPAAQ